VITSYAIRIGIAHGSLKDRPNLPADDHLIALDAADRLGLDYLALGHWHKRLVHRDRTVYTGTHEPMRFPNESPRESTGWVAYSDDGDDDRFADGGVGNAILVEIAGPGAIPKLADFNVGRLTWQAESIDLTGRRVGELERDFSQRPNFDRIVMKLRLFGMTDPQSHRRLDEFKNIVLGRYHAGSEFDADAVMIQPEAEQLRAAVGEGVLARVLERLQTESTEGDAKSREIAEHALKHLYRLAFEDQPA
jgi:DNA repair exonuclease SbcCD nuclease subunit